MSDELGPALGVDRATLPTVPEARCRHDRGAGWAGYVGLQTSALPRGVDGHRAEVAVRDDECGVSVGGFDGRGACGRVDVAEDDVAIRPGQDRIREGECAGDPSRKRSGSGAKDRASTGP